MEYLFSNSGLALFRKFLSQRPLLAFDYDGTIIPICKRLDEALLPKHIARRLSELKQLTPIAIVSGRSCTDLRKWLTIRPNYLIGNHGLEGMPVLKSATYRAIARQWYYQLNGRFDKLKGVVLENKGLSLSVHYRNSTYRASAKEFILSTVKALVPKPRIGFGKCVINIVPSGAPDKGDAIGWLIKKSKRPIVYVGDDITDEDVFRICNNRVFSIRVGRSDGSRARFYLRYQSETTRLLTVIRLFFPKKR